MFEKKSLGILRINANRTTTKSPKLIGKIRLQRHLLEKLFDEIENGDGNEVIAQIAAWEVQDENERPFLNIEIQTKWEPKRNKKFERRNQNSIFDLE